MKEKIIKIITFFDLFNYPLTPLEIWQYLDRKIDLNEVERILEDSSDMIEEKNGFYFLLNRAETVSIRQKRYNYANYKLKIAKHFSLFFKLLPFVKVITVSNSIGAHNLREGSDIDFFIITSSKRIWLSRLFCAGLAKILNRRPTKKDKKDKICLSFYISENHLNLDDLRLPGEDPYFDYWIRDLVLLYNKDKVYEQFLIANNLKEGEIKPRKRFKNPLFNYLEIIAKKWQLKIMAPELKAEMNKSDGVVVNDDTLKLYLHDNRREFLKKYNNKIHEIFKKDN